VGGRRWSLKLKMEKENETQSGTAAPNPMPWLGILQIQIYFQEGRSPS